MFRNLQIYKFLDIIRFFEVKLQMQFSCYQFEKFIGKYTLSIVFSCNFFLKKYKRSTLMPTFSIEKKPLESQLKIRKRILLKVILIVSVAC